MITETSQQWRDLIRSGAVACPPQCRHGWPDIYHVAWCPWQRAIEAVYEIERRAEKDAESD